MLKELTILRHIQVNKPLILVHQLMIQKKVVRTNLVKPVIHMNQVKKKQILDQLLEQILV